MAGVKNPSTRMKCLRWLSDHYGWKTGLELGVKIGETTFHLMKNTNLHMTVVDAWEVQNDNPDYHWQYNEKPKWSGGDQFVPWDHNANEQKFREGAKQWKDRIKIIKGRSLNIIDQIPDKSMDFIFHDSDHSYPFVKNEIESFRCKLKDGGVICGDDITWQPVKQSVEEVFGKTWKRMGKNVWYYKT